MTQSLQALLDSFESRLKTVEGQLGVMPPPPPGGGGSGGGDDALAPQIVAYDKYVADCVDPFVAAADKLGGGAAACGKVFKEAFSAQRDFLVMASKCKKPANYPADVMPKLAPIMAAMKAINPARGEWECHEKATKEALGCLSWLVTEPPAGLPKDVIEPTIGGSDFWANKIRVQFKKTNPDQIAFCDTLKKCLVELIPYAKAHHLTGTTWNPRGVPLADAPAPSAAPAAPAASAAAASATEEKGGMGALADALAAKGNATAGLKTVTKDMQTWRADYKGGDKPAPGPKVPKAPVVKPSTIIKGPPKFEFLKMGMKWLVENQGKDDGVITVTMDPKDGVKHTVYICQCDGATIDIKGKCKGVAIDGCAKTQVLMDSAISSLEVVNSKRMQCQVRGVVPSIAIDKTDGMMTYLSKESMTVSTFTTSKSSEMNISYPGPGDDMLEQCIPEQFVQKLVFKDDGTATVSSSVSDLYTH